MQIGPKFASLYCGTGGLDLGFISAGFRCIAAFDADPTAVDTYNRNLSSHATTVDLRSPHAQVINALKTADIILAGPPCQGFSTAGRNDPGDTRNLHLQRLAELISESRANIVLIENVKGLLAPKNSEHLTRCIAILQHSGFSVHYKLFDLSDYGVPQSRERVIIIGSRRVGPITLESMPKRRKRNLRDAIGHLLPPPTLTGLREPSERDKRIASRIGPGQRLTNVRLGPRSVHTWDIPEVFGHTSDFEKLILKTIAKLRRRNRRRDVGDADPVEAELIGEYLQANLSDTLAELTKRGFLRQLHSEFDLTHTFNGKYKRLKWEECAPTVDTRFIEPRYFLHPDESRGFSVPEMAALQDFPVRFIFPESPAVCSRLIGNAVPPTFAEAVAEQIRVESYTP